MTMMNTGFNNFMRAFYSPEATQTFGNMSAGQGYGQARANAKNFAFQRNLLEEQTKQREAFRRLQSANIMSQMQHRNRPQTPPERYENIYNDNNILIGQKNTKTGKINSLSMPITPEKTERKYEKGADGFLRYIDNQERVFPDAQPEPTSSPAPTIRTFNTPNGLNQDRRWDGSQWVDEGVAYQDSTTIRKHKEGQLQFGALNDALTRYKDNLKKYGTEMWNTEGRLVLGGSHTDLQMELKNLYELGVLAGPDLDLLMSVVKDPTAIMSQRYSGEELLAQIKEVLEPKLKAAEERHNQLYGPPKTIDFGDL